MRRQLGLLLVLVCLFFGVAAPVYALTDAQRAQLQSQLDALEAQIAQQQAILNQKQTQGVSLQRDIDILNAEIKQAQLSIQARDLAIQQLNDNIQGKTDTLTGLTAQMNAELESLAGILREKDQLDNTSLAVAVLSSDSISTFFSDLDSFDQINSQMQDSFSQIQDTQAQTQAAKTDLENQRDQETQLRQAQALQQAQIQAQQDQEKTILTETKGQEQSYEALIAANQKSASQIRAALFQLNGSAAIPFGTALDYATEAQQKTGIRPAFLLGLIREESNLGQNVGTGSWQTDLYNCYLNLGYVTSAGKQKTAFLSITASLGLNPDSMPVSAKQPYGCGGAMGPAQFEPTTWAGYAGYIGSTFSYSASHDRIGALTGNTPPNPWNPDDAFMAAALYLTDNGAAAQSTSAEFRAAMCYLAGCSGVNNQSLQFYGQNVAMYATQYQCQIDIINGKSQSASCN
jgi:peptidoglycan hydrolase CwlO-like protein